MKRTGRPPKEPVPGTRHSLGLKVTADIKTKLDTAARESGRTQSQEAEMRIERSFDREDLLSEVLTLAFGKRTAGILLTMGIAMQGAASTTLFLKKRKSNEDWTSDPDAYREAGHAIDTLWRLAKPDGPEAVGYGTGSAYAKAVVAALELGEPHTILDAPLPRTGALLDLLGPIAARMTAEINAKKERIEKEGQAPTTERTLGMHIGERGGDSADPSRSLSEALSLAYGKQLAGILMQLGAVMLSAAHVFDRDVQEHEDWALDVEAYDAARAAATYLLHLWTPKRFPSDWEADASSKKVAKAASAAVEAHLAILAGHMMRSKLNPTAAIMLELLGPIAPGMIEEWPRERKRMERGRRFSEDVARWEAEEKEAAAKRKAS